MVDIRDVFPPVAALGVLRPQRVRMRPAPRHVLHRLRWRVQAEDLDAIFRPHLPMNVLGKTSQLEQSNRPAVSVLAAYVPVRREYPVPEIVVLHYYVGQMRHTVATHEVDRLYV